jgi:branched-chain amino acid transport system substrate-binding protein
MLADQLTPDQKAHLGVLTCIEITFCSNFGGDLGNRIAKEFGLTVVYSSSATLVQPDYTSNCQRAKEAGVTAFFVVADGGMTSRTIRSCKKVGFDPQFASSPAAMSPSVSELPELENVLLGATVKPWTADDPNAQRYLATLAKYVPGGVPGGSGSIGWASALVLERAGQHLGDSPTPQDIYEGLWTFKNVDFNGFTAPLTYAKDKPASYPTCWWTMVIHDRKWMTPDNGKRSCRR